MSRAHPRPRPAESPTKAIFGGLSGFGGALITAAADGHLTVLECVVSVATGLVAAWTVYQTQNQPKGPS